MDGLSDNAISVINEVAVSLYLYLMLCLTEFYGDASLRNEIGNAMLYLVLITVGLNVLKAAASDLTSLYPTLVRAFRKVLSLLRKRPSPKQVPIKPLESPTAKNPTVQSRNQHDVIINRT